MKVLHVSKYYFPFFGGIEQVARDCVNAMLDYEQKVFCFNHKKGDAVDTVDGVEVIRANCFAKIASQSLSFSYNKLLKKTFKSFNPDVVIFHYPNPFAAHYLLKVLKKCPRCKLIIYWHLDITKQKVLGKLFHGQNKRLCEKAFKIIGATPIHLYQSDYYKYFKDKCVILPYCIDENSLNISTEDEALAVKLKTKYADKTICFAMGRHVPYKGLEYLIKASKMLNEKYVIFIAGEGELTEALKKEAHGDDKIIFLGRITEQQRKVYLLVCDIFCFPSITRNENFGLALAEAMYFGKPSITFTIPRSGVNYVSINNETGLEVPNCDDKKYAEAIKMLASDDYLRAKFGEAAKLRVLNNFTSQKFKENIGKLMEEIK